MIRKLVDYKKLTHEVAALLIESYPYGYGDEDIISFKNMHGDWVEAVEVKTVDTIYLIKISKSLSDFISNFDNNMEKGLETNPEPVLEEFNADAIVNEIELDFNDEEDYNL